MFYGCVALSGLVAALLLPPLVSSLPVAPIQGRFADSPSLLDPTTTNSSTAVASLVQELENTNFPTSLPIFPRAVSSEGSDSTVDSSGELNQRAILRLTPGGSQVYRGMRGRSRRR
ncbi:hypothetical protein QCA50_016130 [Cerrena zonata]|uniref:Uncharacterized protein n=1 Tax=Cerrena zonata TaxID=2478898 RepID=A0AAW0FH04_9APHY